MNNNNILDEFYSQKLNPLVLMTLGVFYYYAISGAIYLLDSIFRDIFILLNIGNMLNFLLTESISLGIIFLGTHLVKQFITLEKIAFPHTNTYIIIFIIAWMVPQFLQMVYTSFSNNFYGTNLDFVEKFTSYTNSFPATIATILFYLKVFLIGLLLIKK